MRAMVAAYLASLLFGGMLIGASMLGVGGDHGGDVHAGGDGDHGGHDHGSDGDPHTRGLQGLAALFGIRFWSFAAAFFGLAGLALHLLGGPGLRALAPIVAGVVGGGAGLGAAAFFRRFGRETIGAVTDAKTLVGRQGRLLLPVDRAQRGKIRLALPAGGHIDLVAEAADDEALVVGTEVLVIEVRGSTAVVSRAPAAVAARPL